MNKKVTVRFEAEIMHSEDEYHRLKIYTGYGDPEIIVSSYNVEFETKKMEPELVTATWRPGSRI